MYKFIFLIAVSIVPLLNEVPYKPKLNTPIVCLHVHIHVPAN